MSKIALHQKEDEVSPLRTVQQDCPLHKGQIILYEGERAKVINIKPFIVIKMKHKVICGDLIKQFSQYDA
jgi:hypothetical protein